MAAGAVEVVLLVAVLELLQPAAKRREEAAARQRTRPMRARECE